MMDDVYTQIRLSARVYTRIEQKVVALYQRNGITEIPINPFEIIANEGHWVKPYSTLWPGLKETLRDSGFEAINYRNTKGSSRIILYDDSLSPLRVKFTLMHELGHIELGHREESDLAKKMADYYDAYSLVPSPLIGLLRCENYIDVAERFQVSNPCADFSFQRYTNWRNYGGGLKPYENSLLRMFQSQ